MFTRLLVGLDGSPGSAAALTAAIDLGRRFSSTIVLAAVTDLRALEAALPETGWLEGPPILSGLPDLQAALAERADRLVVDAEAQVRAAGLTVETVRTSGLVADELVALAGETEAVVVGRRGVAHPAPGELGAEATRLLRRSPKPVLLAGERPSAYQHPLVCYDGGETSAAALTLAARYATSAQVRVDVAHVTSDVEDGDALLAKAGAYLSELGVDHVTHRLRGDVADVVAGHATRSGADLLLVGAHGGRRRRSWGVGSHAEAIARVTELPVIVVR